MSARVLFLVLASALTAGCTNLFAPAASASNADLAATSDVALLLSIGDSSLDLGDWNRAEAAYRRAVALSNISGRARLGVARTCMLRDDGAALAILGSLMSGGTNSIMGFGSTAATSPLYATNGAVAAVLDILRPTNGTSWWAGGCDATVPTNNFTANLLVFYISVLEFPALLFDLHRDGTYNCTNSLAVDGDLLVSSGGSIGVNPSFVSLTNEVATIALDIASGTNLTSNSLLAIDGRISNVHETLMTVLAGLKSADPLTRLPLVNQSTARLQSVPNAGLITNVLSVLFTVGPMLSMVTNDTNVGNFLNGTFFNAIHSGLNGENVVIPSAGIASFSRSNWRPVTSATVVPTATHLQGSLKTWWNFLGL